MDHLHKPQFINKTGRKIKEKKIKEYKVVMLNDHYTTMDFVVEILIRIFHKNHQDANIIMLEIHCSGKAVVGIYPFDIAVTKVEQVHAVATAHDFPLRCIVEPI